MDANAKSLASRHTARISDVQTRDVPGSEPDFHALTKLAAHIAETPIAVLSLMEGELQIFESTFGIALPSPTPPLPFCRQVIATNATLIVPDALQDPLFAEESLVTGEVGLRFYAGFPLRSADGQPLGTLCLIDRLPRRLSSEQLRVLQLLAYQFESQLHLCRANSGLRERGAHQDVMLDMLPGLYFQCTADRRIVAVHGSAREDLYREQEAILGRRPEQVLPAEPSRAIHDAISRAEQSGRVAVARYALDLGGGTEHFECRVSMQPDGSFGAFVTSTTDSVVAQQKLKTQNLLLEAVVRAQTRFLTSDAADSSFDSLLADLLGLTDSEFGFIGEVRRDESGQISLTSRTLGRVATPDGGHDVGYQRGLQQLQARLRDTMACGEPIIDNAPPPAQSAEAEQGGNLTAFLGLPIYSGETLVGVAGIANRPGGYDEELIEFLRPLTITVARLLELLHSTRAKQSAERALLESNIRVSSIVDAALDAIITFDESGSIQHANPAVATLFAFPPASLIGRDITMLMPELHWSGPREPRELHPSTESEPTPMRRDVKALRCDGSAFDAEISISDFQSDGRRFLSGVVRDVSERKRALESSRKLAAVVESSQDAILTLAPDGTITSWNRAAERMFGYREREAVGQAVTLLTPAERLYSESALLGRVLNGRRDTHLETECVRKDGSTVYVAVTLSPLLAEGDLIAGASAIVRDISARRQFERMQADFISTVSHELRTPLTSIRGSLGLIAGGVTGELPAKSNELVQIALSNTERLGRLINDILDIEKVEAGRMTFQFTTVPLAQALVDAVRANQSFADTHDVRLQLRLDEVPPGDIVVDEDRLAQALANLISNAAKFSPAGGCVEVFVECSLARVRISIRDYGPGIPEAFRERVFERFAQGDASVTRAKGGTGLGLSISKAIIEQMRGEIGFEPAPERGTIFFVDLPYFPRVEADTHTAMRRVLVCEDDAVAFQHLIELLPAAGFAVDGAPTLERARQLLGQHQYAAMTLDLLLADGSGVEFLRELRQDPRHPALPVVVLTGTGLPMHYARGHVSAVLPKPIDDSQLLQALSAAARNPHATSEPGARVLHVEDDSALRRGVRRSLPRHWSVLSADSLREASRRLSEGPFDAVLLDLGLPDGHGESLLDQLGKAPVVVFSATHPSASLAARAWATLDKSEASVDDVRLALSGALGLAAVQP